MTTLLAPSGQAAEPGGPASRWEALPAELLRSIAAMALQPRPPDMGTAAAGAVACRHRLPPLREAGQLLAAMERCCRSWRQALIDVPLQISLGPLPLPPNPAAALLRQIGAAGRHRLQALHFEAPPQRGQKPGKVQLLAVELLALEAFSAAAGTLDGEGGENRAGSVGAHPTLPAKPYTATHAAHRRTFPPSQATL